MKSIISGYRHRPGEHCGSTAMRNLLYHYCGLDLSEAFVFGLGSGIEAIYISSPQTDPEALIFGRSATLETDLAEALGIDYREEPEFDNDKAWDKVRREITAGRPTVICADVYYMDHKAYKHHFPFNRFVIIGFDDDTQKAFIHDRYSRKPLSLSYRALKACRNPAEYPILNLWGKFYANDQKNSLEAACRSALKKNALRMTGSDNSQKDLITGLAGDRVGWFDTGLSGLETFRKDFLSWRNREKAPWILSFASRTIETFGTGGGNFRNLYAGFLSEAKDLVPDIVTDELPNLAKRSADVWTLLSKILNQLSHEEDDSAWKTAEALIEQIITIETDLFYAILER